MGEGGGGDLKMGGLGERKECGWVGGGGGGRKEVNILLPSHSCLPKALSIIFLSAVQYRCIASPS